MVRILPNNQHYTVACFHNCQDADDRMRVLRQFITAAEFEIIFAPLEEEQQNIYVNPSVRPKFKLRTDE